MNYYPVVCSPRTTQSRAPLLALVLGGDGVVIRERIGWTRGRTVLFDRIAELRPLFRVPDPVSRTEYQPGELAQCDLWFPPVDIPAGHDQVVRPPVLVMVSGYSRICLVPGLMETIQPGG